MNQFSSTDAKQRFGQLIKASAYAPVAVEKHGKVQAIVVSPEFFDRAEKNNTEGSARQLARVKQAMIEKDRLIRHQKIAFDLATSAPDKRNSMIKEARAMVQRWRVERLCSSDYIERWEKILKMKPQAMAATMVSDADGWGPSLRQNSPWVGLHA